MSLPAKRPGLAGQTIGCGLMPRLKAGIRVFAMPIQLAPISRRKFLTRTALAAAFLSGGRSLAAFSREDEAEAWALLSDIHISADGGLKARGINMREHLEQARREILDWTARPRGVLVCGDCAYNSGESADYARVRDLLRPLREGGLPIHLALGNHDHRERFWEALREEKPSVQSVADRQTMLLRTARVNWFILDSLERTKFTPGLLGPEQLAWLAKALDENAGKPAIVMLHHNPGITGGNMGLKDTAQLLETIRPRRQVKAYVYGHTHSWRTEEDDSGLHLINLPAVSYVFRPTEPSGWVRALIREDRMELELRCIDATHAAHGQRREFKWRS